jgi:hypothetical protein
MSPPSLTAQWQCAQREYRLRSQCYPRWIAQGRIARDVAKQELETMAAIVRTLRELVEQQRGQHSLVAPEENLRASRAQTE